MKRIISENWIEISEMTPDVRASVVDQLISESRAWVRSKLGKNSVNKEIDHGNEPREQKKRDRSPWFRGESPSTTVF